MNRKTVILTGASDGIGAIAARKLAADGNEPVIVGRSPEKTKRLAAELGAGYYIADFAKLSDVRALAASLNENYDHIDILANNAGGIFGGDRRIVTEDGFEKNFQVNHLAPFLLTNLLLETLLTSRATVINTASIAAKNYGNLDINDLQSIENYTDTRAYGTAKIEVIQFSKTRCDRYHARGLNAVAFHPGNLTSNFASSGSTWSKTYSNRLVRTLFMKHPKKGADNLLFFINGRPGIDWTSGEYYHLRKLATTKQTNPQSRDEVLQQQVWTQSAELGGLAT
jgi:NAD(P)-dependent dehydrogenase (short-subunit alcohol dehydrogenase family)